mmetsp:Transcript_19431/g.61118  ORF Transcript_19431/g.61118 Transcript_19431/m.61118 type:complete len:256 (+) Transcript_19431:476-1243(+)
MTVPCTNPICPTTQPPKMGPSISPSVIMVTKSSATCSTACSPWWRTSLCISGREGTNISAAPTLTVTMDPISVAQTEKPDGARPRPASSDAMNGCGPMMIWPQMARKYPQERSRSKLTSSPCISCARSRLVTRYVKPRVDMTMLRVVTEIGARWTTKYCSRVASPQQPRKNCMNAPEAPMHNLGVARARQGIASDFQCLGVGSSSSLSRGLSLELDSVSKAKPTRPVRPWKQAMTTKGQAKPPRSYRNPPHRRPS